MKNKCYFTDVENNLKTVHIIEDDKIVGLLLISKDIELKQIQKKHLKFSLDTILLIQTPLHEKKLFNYQGRDCVYLGTYAGEVSSFTGYSLFQFLGNDNAGWTCNNDNIQAIELGAVPGQGNYYWITKTDPCLKEV